MLFSSRSLSRAQAACSSSVSASASCSLRGWSTEGTWARVHDVPREQLRIADGHDWQPSAAVLDPQSIKTSHGGKAIGCDADKRVGGRHRGTSR